MQEVFDLKIEPRRNVTTHVQAHKLQHGCNNVNEVVDNCWSFSKVWRLINCHFKVVGQIYFTEMDFNVDSIIKKPFLAEIILQN